MKKTCLPKNQNSSCFRLFSWHTIAFVIVPFFNQKHKSLIYKAIKVYYKQNQNDGTRFGTYHFLFCLPCAKIRHNILIFKMVENSQKQIWKVDIILRRKINKRHVTKGVRQVFQLPHILAHVCQKSRNMCQTQIICS